MMVAPEREVPGISAKALRDADFQRVLPGHVVDFFDADLTARGVAFLHPQNNHAADDERQRHRHGKKQIALDQRFQTPGRDRRRNKCYDQIEDESLRGGSLKCALRNAEKAPPILPHNRQHGAGLDDDFKDLGFLAVIAKQSTREYQMPGAGDRQKLGEAFDDTEDDRR